MATLGETLRERRISLGITLEQAEESTRIRGRLLAALEDGNYDKLPNPGYVRGYVSSYARYLELDPQALLQLYKAETGERRSQDLNLPQVDEAVARTGEQHALPWRAALGIVAVIAILVLAVWVVGRIARGGDAEPTQPVPVIGQTESTPTPDQPAGSTPTTKQPSDAANAVPFALLVSVSDEGASWVRITVDGKKAYEGTLTGGQSKSFEVATRAFVKVGKPDSVMISRDGDNVPIPEGDTPTVKLEAEVPK